MHLLHKSLLVDLGCFDYEKALYVQKDLQNKRINDVIENVFIIVEHNLAITIGRDGGYEHLKKDKKLLADKGIKIYEVDRGGSITLHEPGQLVVYPIIKLETIKCDLLEYLRLLERVIIDSLSYYDIKAERYYKHTGVWVNGAKIASIGVSSRQKVTKHGLSLNVNNDLEYFKLINPCGLVDLPVTSVSNVIGANVKLDEIKEIIYLAIERVFAINLTAVNLNTLH